jgi:hypothetical protein
MYQIGVLERERERERERASERESARASERATSNLSARGCVERAVKAEEIIDLASDVGAVFAR